MKIIDLPTWYRTRAYINQKKQGNPTNSGIDVDITREAGILIGLFLLEKLWENALMQILSKKNVKESFLYLF
jgi:hypothetical protein